MIWKIGLERISLAQDQYLCRQSKYSQELDERPLDELGTTMLID
jgi:hypothetical protein